MFVGQIFIDIYNIDTQKFTRTRKSINLPFQPYEGMKFDTGLGSYTLDSIEWSIEHFTFSAWAYISESEHTVDYVHEFEVNGWEVKEFEPVNGYENKFLKKWKHPNTQIIECDSCGGTGLGGIKKFMLGEHQSVCERCFGHKKIIKAW